MNIAVRVILAIAAVVLAYFIYLSIQKPIRFENAKAIRYEKTIQRLKDIRTAQIIYKELKGDYSKDFAELIALMKTGSIPVVKAIGNVPDTLTEKQAVKLGLVIRDTVMVKIMDTIWAKDYPIDSLQFIPFSNGKKFSLETGEIETGSKIKVKVFEASALNKDILMGLDKRLIATLNDIRKTNDQFEGLKVGSIVEVNHNAGNWE